MIVPAGLKRFQAVPLLAVGTGEAAAELLARHPRLTRLTQPIVAWVTEEILASLLGSLLVENEKDQKDLLLKAAGEAADRGMDAQRASLFLTRLREILEKYL